jgi:DNA-binding MarR family transcriptional regulator
LNVTPLSEFVGFALRRAQAAVYADLNLSLAQVALRPGQFAVLKLIADNPGSSQSSVCSALGVQKANFVVTMSDLVRRGLVQRRRSVADGRTYALHLSAQGRRILRRAGELQSVHEQRLRDRLGVQGRTQLLELLDRLMVTNA